MDYTINVKIPAEVYARIERLAPRKSKGQHKVPEFWGRVLTRGLEHPSFIDLEHERRVAQLVNENSALRKKIAITQERLERVLQEARPQEKDGVPGLSTPQADTPADDGPELEQAQRSANKSKEVIH